MNDTPATTLRDLASLGTLMRSAQKRYFKTRAQSELVESKMLESKFDKACNAILCALPDQPPATADNKGD